ncbi:MAG: hypothetical protein N2C14_13435 [Planctomycetales bacterium]
MKFPGPNYSRRRFVWHVLNILTFSLHLLTVYVVSAGPFVCIWLEWRESARGDELAGEIGRRLGRHVLIALAVGIALGFLSLLMVCQLYPRPYLDALMSVPSRGTWLGMPERLWSTAAEILVFVITMWLYLLTWDLWRGQKGSRRVWGRLINRGLGLFSATNVFYHLPVLFAVVALLGTQPDLRANPGSFRELMLRPEIVARVLHGWLAAFAVTGGFLIVLAWRTNSPKASRATSWGARIALGATVLQLPSGFYLLTQIPHAAREQLLGASWLCAGLFGLSILTALGLLHLLAAVAFGETEGNEARNALLALVAVVALMASTRHFLRDHALSRQPLSHAEASDARTPVPLPESS